MNAFTVLSASSRRAHSRLRVCPCAHAHTSLGSSAVQLLNPLRRQQSLRGVHTTRSLLAPDRPTVLANMLASEVPPPVQVSSVGPTGIKLVDGLMLTGPAVFLDGKVLLWDVPGARSWGEWTRGHWEVFEVVVPKPEILIFGTGARMELVPSSIREYIREMGIQLDVMDTKNACATYNLLAEEGRRVAAALLPIEPRQWTKGQGW